MKTCFIIAPGAQLSLDDVKLIRDSGFDAIAVGDVYQVLPSAKYLYASDGRWWRHHLPMIVAEGVVTSKFVTQEAATVGANPEHDFVWIEHVQDHPDLPPPGKTTGTSSGQHALCFAINEGYDNIILVSFEYGGAGEGHFNGTHPFPSATHWPTLINSMRPTAARAAMRGVRIVNCTENTGLDCFKKSTVTEELERLSKRRAPKTQRGAGVVENPAS